MGEEPGAGKMSVITTLVPNDGPLLFTVMVYVVDWPRSTGSELSTLFTRMSSCAAVTGVLVVALLLAAFDSAVAVVAATLLTTVLPVALPRGRMR